MARNPSPWELRRREARKRASRKKARNRGAQALRNLMVQALDSRPLLPAYEKVVGKVFR